MTAARETDHARRRRRDAERAELVARFGNRCQVCGAGPKSRALNVDHDHDTNKVRGLLCWTDNKFLAMRGVTPQRLRALADYLEHPPAQQP